MSIRKREPNIFIAPLFHFSPPQLWFQKVHKFQMNARSLTMFFHQFWLLDCWRWLCWCVERTGGHALRVFSRFEFSNNIWSTLIVVIRIQHQVQAWESRKLFGEIDRPRPKKRFNFRSIERCYLLIHELEPEASSAISHFPLHWLDNLQPTVSFIAFSFARSSQLEAKQTRK